MRGDDVLPAPDGAEQEAPQRDDDTVQRTVRRALDRARDHFETAIEPDLVTAQEYYRGDPFGDEEEGRSKVVSTDMRDAILSQLPSLMRIFYGPRRAVEFRPEGLEDVTLARQMTEYINYVISEENRGFLVFYNWFKDALKLRLGVVKWWHEETYRVRATRHTGLSEDAVFLLMEDVGSDAVEITGIVQDPQAGTLFDARVTRKEDVGCPRFDVVPREEFWYTPGARSLEDAPLVAHVREVTVDTLRQLGIDDDLIDEAVEAHRKKLDRSTLAFARRTDDADPFEDEDETLDESQRKVLFAEAYTLVDGDGDGVAELRMMQCVGPDFLIANEDDDGTPGEIVDELPFAAITPDPEPHVVEGLSAFDLLRDVQRVKSEVLRGTLNSLSQAIENQLVVDPAKTNMTDVLAPEISGVIRSSDVTGGIREIKHQFVGEDTLPVLEYYDQIKEARTGHTKASQGLDADALQSSTKAAVAATLSASQARVDLIARMFAETGVRQLMKGLLKLVVRHQDRARTVRLNEQWVEIDPRSWDADKDVVVNVGLGQGTPEDQVQALAGVLALQEKMMGAGSPLVSWVEVRNAVAEAAQLAGFKNADRFFKPWTERDQQMLAQQQAAQPPQPSPEMLLVQLEQQKQQTQAQLEQMKLQLEQWKAEQENDRERDKMARDAALKEYELELKFSHEHERARVELDIERDRAQQEVEVKRELGHAQAAARATAASAATEGEA